MNPIDLYKRLHTLAEIAECWQVSIALDTYFNCLTVSFCWTDGVRFERCLSMVQLETCGFDLFKHYAEEVRASNEKFRENKSA